MGTYGCDTERTSRQRWLSGHKQERQNGKIVRNNLWWTRGIYAIFLNYDGAVLGGYGRVYPCSLTLTVDLKMKVTMKDILEALIRDLNKMLEYREMDASGQYGEDFDNAIMSIKNIIKYYDWRKPLPHNDLRRQGAPRRPKSFNTNDLRRFLKFPRFPIDMLWHMCQHVSAHLGRSWDSQPVNPKNVIK